MCARSVGYVHMQLVAFRARPPSTGGWGRLLPGVSASQNTGAGWGEALLEGAGLLHLSTSASPTASLFKLFHAEMTKRVATDVDETVTTSKLVAPPRPLSLDVNASQRAQPERQVATRGLAIENSFAESLNMRFCRTKSPAMISSEGDTSINKN